MPYYPIRLPHPWSGESHSQETFLGPSAEKQTHNYDTRELKPPSVPINTEVKGIKPYQDEMVSHGYKFITKCHS